MDQIEAFRDTLAACEACGFDPAELAHLRDMLARIEAGHDTVTGKGFSEAKLGRWLGWAQGVAYALGVLTLDDCKEINRRHSGGPNIVQPDENKESLT